MDKYFRLSPEDNINAPEYFEALDEKLNDNAVKNVAIAGSYGSGKSSIINSYLKKSERDDYIRISLAHFCEKGKSEKKDIKENKKQKINANAVEHDSENSSNIEIVLSIDEDSNSDEIIEEQILQQLIYQFPPKTIPFSKFSKVKHIPKGLFILKTFLFTFWIFIALYTPHIFRELRKSIIQMTEPEYVSQEPGWIILFYGLSLILLLIGGYIMTKEIIKILKKGQLRKVVFSNTQIELVNDSALNKHIDEIIYCFQASEKKLVIFEDLDRFKSISIFSKLREVNTIINNAPTVKQTVTFVYALRDDVFESNADRIKFFDFILPIVPVIHSNNSGDILRKFLSDDEEIPPAFIDDVSLFLHDMRLLKNIVNEYRLYKKVLNNDKKKKSIHFFSIILYKNLFPESFGKEQQKEGLLYLIFNNRKNKLINEIVENIEKSRKILEVRKNEISSETAKDAVKLREEYIFEILKHHSLIDTICDSSISDITLNEELFSNLLVKPEVSISRGSFTRYNPIDFDSIQKNVNEKKYEERLKIVKDKDPKKLQEIDENLKKLQMEIQQIKSRKLVSLIKKHNSSWKNIVFDNGTQEGSWDANYNLLALLLRKGYIHENYPDYISYFYPGALSYRDYDYLTNVKNNEGDNFESKIDNPDVLVNRIREDEFEIKAALNKDLIIYLLGARSDEEKAKLSILFRQFIYLDEPFKKYLLPIYEELLPKKGNEARNFSRLLALEHFPKLWTEIEKHFADDNIKDEFLKHYMQLESEIIEILNDESDNAIVRYFAKKSNFVEGFANDLAYKDVEKTLDSIEVKFNNLEIKKYIDNNVFNYILKNKCYELSLEMVSLMAFNDLNLAQKEFDDQFYRQNLTTILKTGTVQYYIWSELEEYIDQVYLALPELQNEEEIILETILEMPYVEEKTFGKILSKLENLIKDIVDFEHEESWQILFKNNVVYPTWKNLIFFYKKKENKLDASIIEWLGNEYVYETLEVDRITNYEFDEEAETSAKLLVAEILLCNSIPIKAYEKLIIPFNGPYEDIDLDSISLDKVKILLKYDKLKYNSKYYYKIFEKGLYDELVTFTAKNSAEFLASFDEYAFELNFFKKLFVTNDFNIFDKLQLIKMLDDEDFSDKEFVNSVCSILADSQIQNIDNSRILLLLGICNIEVYKLKLLDIYITTLNFEDISSVLASLGGEYQKATVVRKRPKWPLNDINYTLAKKLENMRFFSKVDKNDDKGVIEIVVRFYENV